VNVPAHTSATIAQLFDDRGHAQVPRHAAELYDDADPRIS